MGEEKTGLLNSSDPEENITESEITQEPVVQLDEGPSTSPLGEENPSDVPTDTGMTQGKANWRVVLSVYLIIFSDALTINMAAPYLTEMCRERFGISESLSGMAVGVLFGIFSVCTFITGGYLGHLSDKYGRRPVILMGLISSTLFGSFFFGISPWFWLTLMLRGLTGLTNANFAIGKAVIADVTSGEQRALSFAYLGAAFAISRSLSSALGGLTAGYTPIRWGLFNDPYVFPNLIGTAINFVTLLFAFFFHPETAPKKEVGERTGYVEGLRIMTADPLMRRLLLTACLQSFGNGSLMYSFAYFPAISIQNHGIQFSSTGIGLLYAFFGLVGFLFQVIVFKPILRHFNIMSVYKFGTVLLGISTILFPGCILFYWLWGKSITTTTFTWLWTLFFGGQIAIGFMTGLPILNTFFSNVTDPTRYGIVQGTSQSTMDFVRAFGPLLISPVFSFSVLFNIPFLAYWLLLPNYIVCYLLIDRLSPEEKSRCLGISEDQTLVELSEKSPKENK